MTCSASAAPRLLDALELAKPYAARIASLLRVMDLLDFEIDIFTGLAKGRLAADPGVHRGADHSRDRPDPGRGTGRRDR